MNTVKTIKIVIADDHEIVRKSFKNIIQDRCPSEIDFVAEVANGADLIQAVAWHKPHIVITDIRMPVMDGVQATRIIKKQYPQTAIIAFSMFDDTKSIMNMIQAGASGYLVKSGSLEEIIEAIITVGNGKPYYCSTISEKLYGTYINSNEQQKKSITIKFNEQEVKIMQLICREFSNKQIAGEMNLAIRTVENYRHQILEKIGAKNMVGIALYAVAHEVIKFNEILCLASI